LNWARYEEEEGMITEIVGIDTSAPMLLSTEGSVGQGGKNEASDARLVQTLLNRIPAALGGPLSPLAIDGRVGVKTIGAIKRFQSVTFGGTDGLVDARNKTIRQLISAAMATDPSPVPPRLTPSEKNESDALSALFSRNSPFSKPAAFQTSPQQQPVSALVGSGRSGFGAPFTPSGFRINNNAASFDFTIKDNGFYVARLEIIRDDDPLFKQKIVILGILKTFSFKDSLPFGIDFSLPSFNSTQGTILRGLLGFGPLTVTSLFGACQFGAIGANRNVIGFNVGGSINFFQFGFAPGLPPGSCIGLAVMAGEQKGVPGLSAGGGTGICIPG
jgi:hypothetical protein